VTSYLTGKLSELRSFDKQ